jgi:excisionase family DNA binding protein
MHSVTEAAAKLGLTDRHVRFLLKRGELSGRKLGHDWVVLSLDYKRRRKPKRRGESEAAPGGLRQRPDEVWTEGSF